MIDISLLRLLKYREQYDRLYRSLPEAALDARTKTILQDFGAWFKRFPEADVLDLAGFETWFLGFKHPAIGNDPEKARYYRDIIKNIEPDLEEHIEQGLREQLLELDNATRIANLAERFSCGDDINIMREVATIVEEHALALDKKIECKWVDPDLGELLAESSNVDGLKFRLTVLQEHMRGLQGGDLILVSGRPDSGKTSFLASEITYMAKQLPEDRPVIWFNNEGPGKRILLRIYQAALGVPLSDLATLHKAGKFLPEYEAALGGTKNKIRVKDIHDFYFYEVEDIIREHNPGLVIMDMIDNIKFTNLNGASRTDQVLEQMYQQTRNLGVKYDCPIIATSQISNEGDGLLYPSKGMLKDSKCLGRDVPVRMFDGTVKLSQDIKYGDVLMGPDSLPRNVIDICTGEEAMYTVQSKGWSFVCNRQHIMPMIKATSKPMNGHVKGQVVNMSIDYLINNPSRLEHYKPIQARIEYEERDLELPPYLFGLWLGDGKSRELQITTGDEEIAQYLLPYTTGVYVQPTDRWLVDISIAPGRAPLRKLGVWQNKHIPLKYKTASVAQRQELLAGLMDSDGYVDSGNSVIAMSRKSLIDDIEEVARSLGYRTSVRHKVTNFNTDAWILTISNTDLLPVLLKRKRTVCKIQYASAVITPCPEQNTFYGFTVDADNLYVLGNGMVQHNTGKQGACDCMIMIGQANDQNMATVRGISTPKNKLKIEGKPSCPQEEVTFLMDSSRYKDAQEI